MDLSVLVDSILTEELFLVLARVNILLALKMKEKINVLQP